MKNLTLSIKQIFFDKILSGEKKTETRDIRPSNIHRYCQMDDDGYLLDADGYIQPIKYDTITLYTGSYRGKRPKLVVEVVDAEVFLLEDENGELYILEEDGIEYNPAIIEYNLGRILERP
jgi:hypothetical protein